MKAIGYNTHEGIEGEKSRGNQASSLDIPTSQQRRSGISRSSKRRKKEDERNDSLHRYKATSPSSKASQSNLPPNKQSKLSSNKKDGAHREISLARSGPSSLYDFLFEQQEG
jgi:hypothetical protein